MFSTPEGKQEEGEQKQSSAVSSAVNAVQSYADDISNRTSKLLGLGPKSTIEQLEDDLCACCPTLTYGQRIAGYCFCVFVSFCLTIGAATRLGELLAGDPAPFAIFYTFQNVVSVCSSFFLSGPAAQCKKMCDATRFVLIDSVFPNATFIFESTVSLACAQVATTVYLLSIVATLFFAFYSGLPGGARIGLIVAFIFIQWIALLWYTLSYIPYAYDVPAHMLVILRTPRRREYICSCCQECCQDTFCRCDCMKGGNEA